MSAPVVITAPDGARASIHPHGAQVGSWIPAGGAEQLFVPAKAELGDAAFMGGVPVCFPQFAAGPLPLHGFARDLKWTAGDHGIEGRSAWASFRLADAGPMAGRWPHTFALELRASVGGPSLTIALKVENTGVRSWYFTGALHTYLRVSDIGGVTVAGLEGAPFMDKMRNGAQAAQAEAALRLTGETDRVYLGARGPLTLRDGGRSLEIASTGFPDVVIWNPWSGAEQRFPEFGPDDYRRMLCLEAALTVQPVSLGRGERWEGSQRITIC